jgi:hypothetical protein
MHELVKTQQPPYLYFSGVDEKLARLYQIITRKYPPPPGYRLEQTSMFGIKGPVFIYARQDIPDLDLVHGQLRQQKGRAAGKAVAWGVPGGILAGQLLQQLR